MDSVAVSERALAGSVGDGLRWAVAVARRQASVSLVAAGSELKAVSGRKPNRSQAASTVPRLKRWKSRWDHGGMHCLKKSR